MTHRHDAAWVPSAHEHGVGGFGVLAETIPSEGDEGAAYCYNDLIFPEDNGKEICGRVVSLPSAGVMFAYEDTSFLFSGAPDGTYSFEYQLYVDGVATGLPATVELAVGAVTAGTADATEAADVVVAIGAPVTVGTTAITEAADMVAVNGEVVASIAATAAFIDGADGVAASGARGARGDAIWTDEGDNIVALGGLIHLGQGIVGDGSDSVWSIGSVGVVSTAASIPYAPWGVVPSRSSRRSQPRHATRSSKRRKIL